MVHFFWTAKNGTIAKWVGYTCSVVWLIESSPLHLASCLAQVMRIFASSLRHFLNRPPRMRNGSQEMTPRSSQNILKCADALNLDNDQHFFNTNNFPPPLGKLTSVSSWTFPSSGCIRLAVESAQRSSKWTRRPAELGNIVPWLSSSIVDIFMVGNHRWIDSLSVRAIEHPCRRDGGR
jgi:hypothetical protein